MKVKVKSCPTLSDPMDCSLPGFSVHGIFEARILEWVAISFSRGSSPPREWNQVSCTVGRHFTVCHQGSPEYCQLWITDKWILEYCQLWITDKWYLIGSTVILLGVPGGSDGKASACNAGDPGSIPGLGRSPGEGNGNPLQHSCLENPMDGGAW